MASRSASLLAGARDDRTQAECTNLRGGCFKTLGLDRIGLVDDRNNGNFAAAGVGQKLGVFFRETLGIADDESHVHPGKQREGALDAQLSKRSHIVHARCVDKHHRSDRREFAGLFDGVGRGAGYIAHDGEVLIGERIDEGRFARIATAEQADIKPQPFGGIQTGTDARCIRHCEVLRGKVERDVSFCFIGGRAPWRFYSCRRQTNA